MGGQAFFLLFLARNNTRPHTHTHGRFHKCPSTSLTYLLTLLLLLHLLHH
jgi:hypothetical protein